MSWPLRIRETVVMETPARSATSRSVTVSRTALTTCPPRLLTCGLWFREAETSRLIVKPDQDRRPDIRRRSGGRLQRFDLMPGPEGRQACRGAGRPCPTPATGRDCRRAAPADGRRRLRDRLRSGHPGAAELRPPPLRRRDDGRPVAGARAPIRRPSRRRPRGHDNRGRGARRADCRLPEFGAVVGLGGGRALDVAKFFAWRRGRPLFQVPTSMGTNAAFAHRAALRHEGLEVGSPGPSRRPSTSTTT